MSLKQSISNQKNLEALKKSIDHNFFNDWVSDVILLEYPAWSICYKDGGHTDSYQFNATTRGAIYNYLRDKYTDF